MALSRSENGMGGTPGKGVNFPPPWIRPWALGQDSETDQAHQTKQQKTKKNKKK